MKERPIIFDVQTSGATPSHGRILEVGWLICGAASPAAPSALLVRGSESAPPVPPRILALIGIKAEELAAGVDEPEVFARLADVLPDGAFVLAHFATFEKRFLDDLWQRHAGIAFPLPFVCTHAVCKRLYPDLPSRALRAIAGYLGLTIPQEKRAASHVEATAHIWAKLVPALTERGLTTSEALLAWLAEKPARQGARRPKTYALARADRLALPDRPGIYKMLGHDGRVLYVGKATSLKSRVNSYFRGRKGHSKAEMLTQVFKIETVVCGSALEAALLETDEIKRLDPPYNVSLKMGARKLGWLDRELQPSSPKAAVFGPFPREDAMEPLRVLHRVLASQTFDSELVFGEAEDEVLAAGLALVVPELSGKTLRTLLATGVWEARRRKAAAEEACGETGYEDEERVEAAAEETPLTAEDIAVILRSHVINAGFSYLRSRQIRQLAGASVTWREKGSEARRTLAMRYDWRALDIGGYDRLRVLATELLHLRVAGAEIHL